MICVSPPKQATLRAHSSCVVPDAWCVSVSFARESRRGALNICYTLPVSGLRLPPLPNAQPPVRVDGLWQHTCAELFIAMPGNQAYREFNFSANGDWAAYDFVDYRVAAASLPQIVAPKISSIFVDGVFCIDVQLDVSALPDLDELQLGATVVLEADDDRLSYWAAFHPCVKPDFHHRDGFVLKLV